MASLFGRFQELAYTLFRIAFGVLFAFHGAQKLFGILGRDQASSALMWTAGSVEFFGGLAIALGLFTPVAALLCAGQMAVAYFYAHQPRGLFPIQNAGELALLYFFGFLLIMTRGGGKWAIQRSGKL